MRDVLVVEQLALPVQKVPLKLSRHCKKQTGIWIDPYEEAPDILIGQSHLELLIINDYREVLFDSRSKLLVSRCILGWTLHGQLDSSSFGEINVLSITDNRDRLCKTCNDGIQEINNQMKQYFELENVGTENTFKFTNEDRRAIEILNKTSKYVNGTWEVGLLWKNADPLPTNGRSVALHRMNLLKKKLELNEAYAKLYGGEISRLFENNFAEKISKEPVESTIYYLPHFGVQNANKPGKVRLVFDAAAKTGKVSFNSLLVAGPDLLKSLPGILMRFRQFRYAIKSDMKDMFLKIKIREEDRHAQRFFWPREGEPDKLDEYVMSSMLFGAKSSPCTALYIKNKNASLFMDKYPESARSVIENCYMDDYLESCESFEEAVDRVAQVTEINKHANWEMHSWASNDDSILNKEKLQGDSNKSVTMQQEEGTEKILGMRWLNGSDFLIFHIDAIKIPKDSKKVPTKREFLSIIMSIFDPLGFLTPFTIHSRIIMQDVWISEIKWDEKLKQKEFDQWEKWLEEFKKVENLKINRSYQIGFEQQRSAELHVFCDASLKACATVGYWRFILPDGSYYVSFIASKSRVKPKTGSTIPRLELHAAVLAAKIATFIENEHDIVPIRRVFWTDSSTVIQWINKDPREFKIYVATRIDEIQKKTKASEWRWVPTKDNPADDGTRYSSFALQNDSRWFRGPQFLWKNESEWPQTRFINTEEAEKVFNIERVENVELVSLVTKPEPIIDFSRFSKLNRLIYMLVRVLKMVDRARKINRDIVDRKHRAELICIKISQRLSFPEEIEALAKGNPLPKRSRILACNPKLDKDGVLRCEGRARKFFESNEKANPIILDAKELYPRLIIKNYHEKYFHANHETIVNELNQKFWILGLRRSLRYLVNKCVVCRAQRAKPVQTKMGDLPPARLACNTRAFTYCGVDFFGPMQVTVGRRREKRYGILFTCMTVRAVHIDLVHSLSTDSAIMALKRFISQRGRPKEIFCDNGTNLRGMSNELAYEMGKENFEKINGFAAGKDIKWKFNPPSAPFMGGAWERLIKSVKNAMNVALKDRAPHDEALLTTLKEIEHCLNSRPLSFVSSDPSDQEALTPNHFLLGSSSGEIRFGRWEAQQKCTRKQWKTAQHYADVFWQRWIKEYLPTLSAIKKWHTSDNPLKIGEVVAVADDNLPRNQWKKGIVARTLPGPDNEIRVVELRTANGILIRPARKLIRLLEVET